MLLLLVCIIIIFVFLCYACAGSIGLITIIIKFIQSIFNRNKSKNKNKSPKYFDPQLNNEVVGVSNVKWKVCWNCGRKINEVAKKCPYCEAKQ